jgi:DNA primase
MRMYINVRKHLVWCHNCGFSGSIINLIQDTQGVSYYEAVKIFRERADIQLLPASIKEEILSRLLSDVDISDLLASKESVPVPEESMLLSESSTLLARNCKKYLRTRHIHEEQILEHKLMYSYSGRYKNRLIVPMYELNQLKFWVARSIITGDRFKELSPDGDSSKYYEKGEVIFNIDVASMISGEVVLTEGYFDACMFQTSGASILGSHLTSQQHDLLLKYKPYINKLYIALDEDANKKSIDIAVQLSSDFPVFFCDIKDDPNKMGVRACRRAKRNATEYTTTSRLNRLFGRR